MFQLIDVDFKEHLKNLFLTISIIICIVFLFFNILNQNLIIFIAGSLGMKKVELISIIKKAYRLYRAGKNIRTALSLATGGWGFAVNLLANAGLTYLVSNLDNPVITF
jgi:hypothetical protein